MVGISSNYRTGVGPHGIDPQAPSQSYLLMVEDWEALRTVYSGTHEMRKAGEKYLPKHRRESKTDYENRLKATALTNVLRDAIQNTASRPFRKRLALTETSSEIAHEWSKDLDLQGRSLHMVAIRAFREALLDGMVHVLIDMINVPAGASAADERAMKSRPYWRIISARDLIAAYSRFNSAGEKICYHARIKENSMQLRGFVEELVERVRVFRVVDEEETFQAGDQEFTISPGVCVWELWEKTPGGWAVIEGGPMLKAGGIPWDRVPIETFYTGADVDDFTCTPPFLDLALLNIIHWQSSSDQRNILTAGRFPILAASGLEDIKDILNEHGELTLGPYTALVTPSEKTKWYYVEPTGAAIEAGFKDLKQLVEDMRVMGIDPLMPQNTGQQTATEGAIDESKARAPLEQWAWEFADFIARVYDRMFEWIGMKDQIGLTKVLLDTDMAIATQKDQDMQILIQLRGMRDLSRHSLYEELKRRGLLGPYFDPVLEQKYLDDEAMTAMDAGFDPMTGAVMPPEEDSMLSSDMLN